METSRLQTRKPRGQEGFSLMETMVAIVILTVGMLSLAALMSKMTGSTETSRYMSAAAMLASEKLEDLSRLSATDPDIAVTSGSQVGDLTTNSPGYFDQVYISTGGNNQGTGGIRETVTSKNGSGQTTYGTYTHQPDGTVTSPPSDPSTWVTTTPALTTDTLIFTRRWVIEQNPIIGGSSVAGVRRITVLVTLNTNTNSGPPINFRMSTVRQ